MRGFYTFAPMQNVLDNPIWNALISEDAHLGSGTDDVKFYHRQVSPFAGLKAYTEENFKALYDIMPGGNVGFMSKAPLTIPPCWEPVAAVPGYQMLFDITTNIAPVTTELTPLTEGHVPQMLKLTQLTKPGPFDVETIRFGKYYGVFAGSELVAMAGHRMHPFNYTEISAVCTHPEHLGRGYAKQLMLHQLHLLIAEGKTPFLHVRGDNDRAINIYKALGFSIRTDAYFTFVKK